MFRRLKPPAVYITAEAEQDERCARRVERMLAAIDCETIERGVDDARLAEIIGSIADHVENAGDMMRAMVAK